MAEYFDADHAREVAALGTGFTARTEWPTWLLIAVIYGGWFAVLTFVRSGILTIAAATPCLIVLCAWQCRSSTNCCTAIPPGSHG